MDGHVAHLGQRVDPRASIRLDNRLITAPSTTRRRVLAYRKPEGELCTRADSQARPTVFDHLPQLSSGRWITVGRLDINTSGLLLITTDGDLAAKLMHPSTGIEREYACRVQGQVTPAMSQKLTTGVLIDAVPAKFDKVTQMGGPGSNQWYRVVLTEGRYREVRRLWQSVGARVSRLIRIRVGPISLDRDIRLGHWRELSDKQIEMLLGAAGMGTAVPS